MVETGKAEVGLIGLAVMGRNLALHIADHGIAIAIYNRTTEVRRDFISKADVRPQQPIATASESDASIMRKTVEGEDECDVPRSCALLAPPQDTIDAMIHAALQAARATRLVTTGDCGIVVGGAPSTPLGHTDFLRLVTVANAEHDSL